MRYPYGGDRQIIIPQPIVLGRNSGGSEAPTQKVEFRVQIPDSRLRVKTTVIFVPDAPVFPVDISTMDPTLYLAEEEECYSGAYSGYLPVNSIIPGTSVAAPLALPANASLLGYSIESVTAADAIHGFLTWSSGAIPGIWSLQTRYQPDGQRLPDKDWAETKQLCNATILGGTGAS